MSINSTVWTRRYSANSISRLMTPALFNIALFELPLGSVYHYQLGDGIEYGPAGDDLAFRNNPRPVAFQNVTLLDQTDGNPRYNSGLENNIMREFRLQNRRARPSTNLANLHSDNGVILTINYAPLGKTYRYVKNAFTVYHKWHNATVTMVNKMMAVMEALPTRNHYFFTSPPPIIPSVSVLDACVGSMPQTDLRFYVGRDSYWLLEIWRWLSKTRSASMLSRIPRNRLHLVNFVYFTGGRWCVVNLGFLDSFRLEQLGDPFTDQKNFFAKDQKHDGLEPQQVQRRFLRFLMSLQQEKTITANTTQDQDVEIDEEAGVPVRAVIPDKSEIDSGEEAQQAEGGDDDFVMTKEERQELIKKEDDQLERELAMLNDIHHEGDPTEGNLADVLTKVAHSPEHTVSEISSNLMQAGLITAKENGRFKRLASAYKEMPCPYGEYGTMAKTMDISSPKLLALEREKFPESISIHDPSMLESSLSNYHKDYSVKALNKHTAAMVMGIQNAGFAVTAHSVNRRDTILGKQEVHSIKLVPIEGAPSTVTFTRPMLDEDGTFMSNGTKYMLRPQRVDIPIRKVDSMKVALTSYYGKLFVKRGSKRTYDYGAWICSKVMADAMSRSNPLIKGITPGECFDSKLKCPRPYSALAMQFRSIQTPGYVLMFDQQEVRALVPSDVMNSATSMGNLVIAWRADGNYLTMDHEGGVYENTPNKPPEVRGLIEDLLGLATNQSPVEFAEVEIFKKPVAVGLILAYYWGLSTLLQTLGVQVRREQIGARTQMTIGEFSINFVDERLIFSRGDKLACMILGGLKEYEKVLSMYSVYSFDQKGVYLNVIDASRLGARYMREMDLMNQLFIDPLTLQELIKMKEPQQFTGLLVRACQMLLTDEHPDEMDPDYMRTRGNERFAGAIYSELIGAIRHHNAQTNKSNRRIDIAPYAVEKRIFDDSSKIQVNELNPIQAILHTQEAYTFSGSGGRSTRSMTKKTRAFHPNSMGLDSEASADSGMVGINATMCANPRLNSLSGTINKGEPFSFEKTGAASMLSTAGLLSVGTDCDD